VKHEATPLPTGSTPAELDAGAQPVLGPLRRSDTGV